MSKRLIGQQVVKYLRVIQIIRDTFLEFSDPPLPLETWFSK